ncbi:MAG: hypothetical protein WAO76_02160 [Georgfuchsia sp.]
MNTLRNVMTLALTAAFAAPIVVFATDKPVAEHACHHPEQARTENPQCTMMQEHATKMHARIEAMQKRMKAMEETADPKARMPLMKEQMADMQAVMKDMENSCPMACGKSGMHMMDHDMHEGMGMMGHDIHDDMDHGDQMMQLEK